MILAFKNDRTELDLVTVWLADSALADKRFFGDIDFFVPVPLHWRRRFIRGYNQSLLLARGLKHPSAKTSTDLARIRYTKAQPTMPTLAARERNVAGAFAVRYRHPFAGRRICLVDDIKTTGATLNECAKTLKEAGASKGFCSWYWRSRDRIWFSVQRAEDSEQIINVNAIRCSSGSSR